MNELHKTILRHEAKLGAKIFQTQASDNSAFYCLNARTWVWRSNEKIIFYRVNPASVYKSNDGESYRLASEQEVKRLHNAAKIYRRLIESRIYSSLLNLS